MIEQEMMEAIKNGKRVEYKVGVLGKENEGVVEYVWVEYKDPCFCCIGERMKNHEFRIKTFEWRFKTIVNMIRTGIKIYAGNKIGFFIEVKEGYGMHIKWEDLTQEINPALGIGLPNLVEKIGVKIEL